MSHCGVANPRGGEVLFADKTMFLPYIKEISNTYSNTILLCGEGSFAATRGLTQKRIDNGGLPRGGEVLFADKTMFLPYKGD